MKVTRKLFALLLLFGIFVFVSCKIPEIPQIDPPGDTLESATDADSSLPPPAERFTVEFEENEAFPTETERKASERIDSAFSADFLCRKHLQYPALE